MYMYSMTSHNVRSYIRKISLASQSFRADVIDFLWRCVDVARHQQQPIVVNTAFASLAKCDVTRFEIRHFPVDVIGTELAGALEAASEQDDVIIPPVTGKLFVDLLVRLETSMRTGFKRLKPVRMLVSSRTNKSTKSFPVTGGMMTSSCSDAASRAPASSVPMTSTGKCRISKRVTSHFASDANAVLTTIGCC